MRALLLLWAALPDQWDPFGFACSIALRLIGEESRFYALNRDYTIMWALTLVAFYLVVIVLLKLLPLVRVHRARG